MAISTSPARRDLVRRVPRDPVLLLAFGLGAGLSPLAPGTAGTLVALPLWLLLSSLPLAEYLAVAGLLLGAGVVLCGAASRRLGVHDHPGIVWDEVVGFLLTMAGAPAGWTWLLLGFLLFRLFDILKPWPINRVDRQVQGGLGIMLDDVLAAVYAAVAVQLVALSIGAG
jgi:phosphatidylglycerophosphatase A